MSLILSICAFALSMSITPGPVNLITLSSGLEYGFRQTLSFVTGATVGFSLLLLIIGLGLGTVTFKTFLPYILLSYLGAFYIVYMGIVLIRNKTSIEFKQASKKPHFFQGVILQWLNPKAWLACLAGISGFGLNDSNILLFIFVGIYSVICYCSIASWAIMGAKMADLINHRKWQMVFNRSMGVTLIIIGIDLFIK